MLEVELTGHHGGITTGNGRNDVDLEKFKLIVYLNNEDRQGAMVTMKRE